MVRKQEKESVRAAKVQEQFADMTNKYLTFGSGEKSQRQFSLINENGIKNVNAVKDAREFLS